MTSYYRHQLADKREAERQHEANRKRAEDGHPFYGEDCVSCERFAPTDGSAPCEGVVECELKGFGANANTHIIVPSAKAILKPKQAIVITLTDEMKALEGDALNQAIYDAGLEALMGLYCEQKFGEFFDILVK